MTEILTESFCERCGTRYTFESNAPRRSRVGRVRTLSKGLRNFVLSDESSFSEAMADARSEEELSATAHQLDAFHETFNFCLTCRQYTCGTCWNQTEGRCLTCAPMPEAEVAGGPSDGLMAGTDGHEHVEIDEAWPEADLERINAVLGQPPAPEWPRDSIETASETASEAQAAELGSGIETEAVPSDQTRPSEVVAAEPAAAVGEPEDHARDVEGRPAAAPATAAPADRTDADWAATTAAAANAPGTELIGVAPGQSLEDAVAAYESRLAEQELAEAESAASAAAEPPAAPASETRETEPPTTEPVSDAAEPAAPAPAATEAHETLDETPAQPAAATEDLTAPEDRAAPQAAPGGPTPPPPAAAPTDVIAQPTWPVAPTAQPTSDGVSAPAPPPPAAPAPPAPSPATRPAPSPDQGPAAPSPDQGPASPSAPWLRVAPDDNSGPAPQWPTAPARPTASGREMPTTLAGRPLLPRDDASALWAASAREVLGPASGGGPAATVTASPQPCVQCGLSLSANARFCRRCGSRQG